MIELLRDMIRLKTPYMIDKQGTIWRIGKFYDQHLHFRTGFGHWSEMVLDEWMYPSRAPFHAYVHIEQDEPESPISP